MPLLPSHTLLQTYAVVLAISSYLLLFNPLALLNASPLWLLGESMHIPRASFLPSMPNVGTNPTASAPGVTLQGKKSLIDSVFGTGDTLLHDDIREVLALLGLVLLLATITQSVLAVPLRYSKASLWALAQKSKAASSQGIYNTDLSTVSEFAGKVHTLNTAQSLFLTVSALRVIGEGVLVACIYLFYSDRTHRVGGSIDASASGHGLIGLLANRVVFTILMSDMLFWGYLLTVIREEARDVTEILARRTHSEESKR